MPQKDGITFHTINFTDQIDCFNLSEYELSQNLIVIACSKSVMLGAVKYQVSSHNLFFIFQD